MKQLNFIAQIRFLQKPTKRGRTHLTIKQQQTVWEFWHQHSTEATNTNQIAKLGVTDKSSIQAGLEFAKTVTTIQQRNRDFYQSIVKIVEKTFRELYRKYLSENPVEPVSHGILFALCEAHNTKRHHNM